MKLDDVEQRFKLIDGLIKVSFKNDEIFMPGNENYYEWLSNIEIMKLLISVSDMIRIERVFINTDRYVIERLVSFSTNKFASRRLMKFQSDLRDTMDEMREVYAEIYGV